MLDVIPMAVLLATPLACAPAPAMSAMLRDRFAEVLVDARAMPDGSALTFYFAEPSGSWSVLRQWPTGNACLLAIGHGATQPAAPAAT